MCSELTKAIAMILFLAGAGVAGVMNGVTLNCTVVAVLAFDTNVE